MNTSAIPRLRDEVIVRPFDGGGTQPRYVVAVDGHHFVVTPTVAAVLDETRNLGIDAASFEPLARRVSQRLGTTISPRQIETLLNERIPKAFFQPARDTNPSDEPLMFRRLLLSGEKLRPLLLLADRLFTTRAAMALVTIALALNLMAAWRAWANGATALAASDPIWALVLTLTGIFLHELGHLTACHRFGGGHGGIGIGLYWCVPAFYAEVHGAWLLPRRQRAAVDAGGVYFQCLFAGMLAALYLLLPHSMLSGALVWTWLLMLHTLNPVLKFDGYWLLSDLAGIHNLHRRVRDTVRRILSGLRHGWSATRPSRAELGLLGAFALIACAYFAYLLGVLGHNLGLTAARFWFAFCASDHSTSALLGAFGRGVLLALMLAMAAGVAILLARAGGAVVSDQGRSSNEP